MTTITNSYTIYCMATLKSTHHIWMLSYHQDYHTVMIADKTYCREMGLNSQILVVHAFYHCSSNDFKTSTFPLFRSIAYGKSLSRPSRFRDFVSASRNSIQRSQAHLVSTISICFVLGNELHNPGLAILRCQLGCNFVGLVKHVNLSTPPKQ
jgi:hypothetical protein